MTAKIKIEPQQQIDSSYRLDAGNLQKRLASLYKFRQGGIKLGLDSITGLMAGLNNPHKSFRSIHIAGTNGKGSIAAIISSILAQAGYKVGLFTSPHLVRFNERIRINNLSASDATLIEAAEAVEAVVSQQEHPTFFEYATAMAFYCFAQERVDWGVVEVGMGGRLDATNVIMPDVSVISSISLDHQQYLGNTIAKIAWEKGGIIKYRVPVVIGAKRKKACEVIEKVAAERHAAAYRLGRDFNARKVKKNLFFYYSGIEKNFKALELNLLGDHQIDNAATALAAIEVLMQRGNAIPEDAVRIGISKAKWPGRLEVVAERPMVILDGAHNIDGVRTLRRYLEKLGSQRIVFVVGFMSDKSWKDMLRRLLPVSYHVIATRVADARAEDPHSISAFVRLFNDQVEVISEVGCAIDKAVDIAAGINGVVCVTGSLYLIGEAKAYMEKIQGGIDQGETMNPSAFSLQPSA
ncbi:MAG: folylpolyglutamate synthase/dihydrofolate synthase family protein [Pseudomonadota bacterium]